MKSEPADNASGASHRDGRWRSFRASRQLLRWGLRRRRCGFRFCPHRPRGKPTVKSGPTAEPVIATDFATVLGDRDGPLVSTAEHVLAALRGMGVDNATIEIDGPEVPIMDGSAAPFVDAIDQAGIVQPAGAAPLHSRSLKPIRVAKVDVLRRVAPHAHGFRVELEIDFANPLIGQQGYALRSRARTLPPRCRAAPALSASWATSPSSGARAYALGASFENTVVFDDDRLLNTEGLRYADECARHKVLDVIGDLALAGVPLLGTYRSVRGGHKLNHAVLTGADGRSSRLAAGRGPRPPAVARPRARSVAACAGGLIAAAYGPDVS